MESYDPISTVEAVYRLDVSDREWMSGILRTIRREWDDGFGVGMFDVRIGDDGLPEIGTTVFEGELGDTFDPVVRAMNASLDQAQVEHSYRREHVFGTLSERMKEVRPDFREDPVYREYAHPHGVYDFLATKVADPSGTMLLMGAPLEEIRTTTESERAKWSRVAAHVAAGFRLRLRGLPNDTESSDVDAVLSSEGHLLHLDSSVLDADASRESLERAAEDIGRARAGMRQTEPYRALELWQALVDGRYTLVEHIDTDGQTYLLARRNDPKTETPAALDQRARQIVQYAALGHSNPLIAYELGFDEEVVSTVLDEALSTLNLDSRDALVQLRQTLERGK